MYVRPYLRNNAHRLAGRDWFVYMQVRANAHKSITPDQLLYKLVVQDFKCALSGLPMTCIKNNEGWIDTNARVNVIVPGYRVFIRNIQLVCNAVGAMKHQYSQAEFIHRCMDAVADGSANAWHRAVAEKWGKP